MDYYKWLETLKPGDKVYVVGFRYESIRTIDRITPTGRIILKGSKEQFINGKHRINNMDSEHIKELTDEIKTKHILKIKLQKINKYELTIEEPDKINKIYDIIKE